MVDTEASNKWLTNADLFAETEGCLTAIQNQVIPTRNYKKYILKQPNIDEYPPCFCVVRVTLSVTCEFTILFRTLSLSHTHTHTHIASNLLRSAMQFRKQQQEKNPRWPNTLLQHASN
jgi:hypothetical protein